MLDPIKLFYLFILANRVLAQESESDESIFIPKEEADSVLGRAGNKGFFQKLFGDGGFLEEAQPGNAERECYEEVCNYEEAFEVYDRQPEADELWRNLTDLCSKNHCSLNGTLHCENRYRGYKCHCQIGFNGEHCERADPCYPNPCSNNGRCLSNSEGDKFMCECALGYLGESCKVNICLMNRCQNGATCSTRKNRLYCLCQDGFAGKYCQDNINMCSSSPCLNGATCTNGINFYKCTCKDGFTGPDCSKAITCPELPVIGDGTTECSDGNSYGSVCTTTCLPGFISTNPHPLTCTGDRSSEVGVWDSTPPLCQDIDECELGHCPEGSVCINEINSFSCQFFEEEDDCGEDQEDITDRTSDEKNIPILKLAKFNP